ncbi:MAG: BamA/TamA family outer membrane protein [Hyphomonadaceae bacterium]|nr:BamA/TamA family outer membrane protein [Hyphomonadaceae bacterium]
MRFSPILLAAPAAALAWALAVGALDAASPVAIEGVGGEIRQGIERALPERDAPQSLFDAERLAEEAAERATRWLRAEGWYAAEVTPEAEEEPPVARVRIAPGERFTFAAPTLTFSGATPEDRYVDIARDALARIVDGAPARAADVLGAEAAAVAALRAAGFPDARAAPRRVVVDHDTRRMTPAFAIDAGAPVRLGGVRVQPEGALRADYVARLAGWERGDRFKPDSLALLRRDLASTGAFTIVNTTLATEAGPDGARDVIVTLERAKPRVLEVGAGWSTTEGFGVEAEWTRRNVTRRADSLTVDAVLGEQVQSLTGELVRPNAVGSGRSLRLTAGLSHDNSGPFDRNGFAISAAVDAARRLRLALSYGVAATADVYSQSEGVENAYVFSGFADVRRDETDSPLDARRGYLLQARLEPAVSTGDASVAFARATAQARAYVTPDDDARYTVAARVRTGWVEPLAGEARDLPPDRLFYAGGGGSVRGYDFNSIFPVSRLRIATPPGGRGLLETSGEVRARFTDRIGGVAFVDGGNAFNDVEDATDFRWGVGAGVRYDLGFAPLRLDVAAPLDPRPGDARVAFYVSIGQAF